MLLNLPHKFHIHLNLFICTLKPLPLLTHFWYGFKLSLLPKSLSKDPLMDRFSLKMFFLMQTQKFSFKLWLDKNGYYKMQNSETFPKAKICQFQMQFWNFHYNIKSFLFFFCWLAAWRNSYKGKPWQPNHFVVITLYLCKVQMTNICPLQ